MNLRNIPLRIWFLLFTAFAIFLVVIFGFRESIYEMLKVGYNLLTEREHLSKFVASFGISGPLVFMAIQVLQVVLAPIPGEATGFIGGYLFGAFQGCIYSSLALTLGSWINFCLGRYLGKRWVRKMIPPAKLARFDYLLRHQGVLIVFAFFIIPGFPKDYLCLFLGISTMPMRVFLLLTALGRIPGTLMLSLQGALLFNQNYIALTVFMLANGVVLFLMYCYRESLYSWIEKINGNSRK